MRRSTLEALAKGMAPVIREFVARSLRPLEARIDAAKVNLADAYRGVWHEGDMVRRGDLFTHGGGLWLCLKDSSERPGSCDDHRLIVKRGSQP